MPRAAPLPRKAVLSRHATGRPVAPPGPAIQASAPYLGHSSISVTMDRYGHLFPSDMEALAAALDEVRREALANQMRTNCGPDVVELNG